MLCNEHGLFLEIAQVIRSFNLTILKGVMESYSNDTWAHFIVEVITIANISDSFQVCVLVNDSDIIKLHAGF